MKISETVLLDSNILIYAHNQSSPFHQKAYSFLSSVVEGKTKGVITPQNLLEFYSISTDPKRVERIISAHVCLEIVQTLLKHLDLIYPNKDSFSKLNSLVDKRKTKGARIFDAFLAATMLSNGIKTIVTVNVADFLDFSQLKVINLESLD